MSVTNVAMIGLGRMGGPMADHVIRAGFATAVFDVSPDAIAPRVELGARAAASPADAAEGAQVVGVVVFDAEQAQAVLDGPDGLLRALAPGAVVCIHTTVSIDAIHALAALATPHGVHVLDAGISGGETGAQAGTLLSMVGGPPEAVTRAASVIDAFSKDVLHAGPLGTGMALKLARNATSFAMMGAVYEALCMAHGAGVDPKQLKHALTNTGLFEQALVVLGFGGPEPLAADAPEGLRAMLGHTVVMAEKDLDQAVTLSEQLGTMHELFSRTREIMPDVMRVRPAP